MDDPKVAHVIHRLNQFLTYFSLCYSLSNSLHKKWSFSLRISSVNVTKPAEWFICVVRAHCKYLVRMILRQIFTITPNQNRRGFFGTIYLHFINMYNCFHISSFIYHFTCDSQFLSDLSFIHFLPLNRIKL